MSIDTKYGQSNISGNKRSWESVSEKFIPRKLSKSEEISPAHSIMDERLSSLIADATYILNARVSDRPHLTYHFQPKIDLHTQLYNFIASHHHESGIIFATTRKVVDNTFSFLQQQGFKVGKSHSGISHEERIAYQKSFMQGEIYTIIATGNVSLEVDKPDIRYILHHGMPGSIEQYYQEMGLAGKDGQPAECLMLYSSEDLAIHNYLQSNMDESSRKLAKEKTKKMYDLCLTKNCRRIEIMNYFEEFYPSTNCAKCDNCTEITEMCDETVISQKILACILQLGESFGINHVIDVLRGSNDKAVRLNGHNTLSTYGSLSEQNEISLRQYIYSLMQMGFLKLIQVREKYPVLQWTEKTHNRKTDGSAKILLPKQKTPNTPPSLMKKSISFLKSQSSEKTVELFLQGESVETIAQNRGLAKSTVVEHLCVQIQLGKNLDISTLVSAERQKTICGIIAEVGSEKLAPIKERLPEFTYDEIHLVAAFSRRKSDHP